MKTPNVRDDVTEAQAVMSDAHTVLCDEAEPRGLDAGVVRGMVGIREVRRAINDVLLASEPSGSEQ